MNLIYTVEDLQIIAKKRLVAIEILEDKVKLLEEIIKTKNATIIRIINERNEDKE